MALPFIDGLNRVMQGLVPVNNAGGLIDPTEAQSAQQQGLLGLGAGLLGSAGPNRLPVSFGQALSAAALQSNGMQNNAIDDALKRRLVAAETLQRLQPTAGELKLIPIMTPNGPKLVRAENAINQTPYDRPLGQTAEPGSLQELDAINKDRASRGEPAMKPEEYLAQRRGSSADSQLYAQYVNGEVAAGRRPLPIDQFLAQFKGDVAGAQQLGDVGMKRLDAQFSEAQGAQSALGVIGNARQLLDEGVKTGTAATQRNAIARTLDTLLGRKTDNDALSANTDAYIANAGQLVGQVIKQFGSGSGLSDADRAYAQQIAGGNVAINEAALRRILEIQERAQRNLIRRYNSQYDRLSPKYSQVSDFYERIPEESPYAPVGKNDTSAVPSKPPNRNARGWVLHQDANGNRAYVSPDGKQYEPAP